MVRLPAAGGNQYTMTVESEDLQAAEKHIARLEEELLRRKDVQRELDQMRSEHQRLRRGVEGRFVQLLTVPFRLFRSAKTSPKKISDYEKWFEGHRAGKEERSAMRALMRSWPASPLVSILLPAFESDPKYLRAAVASVRAQIYENWELLVADDGSKNSSMQTVLKEIERCDQRIRVLPRAEHGGISAALNRALAAAQGEWIALLDHDDWIEPDAIFRVIESLQKDGDVDVFYSDEDKIIDDRLAAPMFKPDWSPDLFLAHDYIGHLVVLRRAVLAKDEFRSAVDGAQDYDLLLRISERTQRFRHLSRVLYHWRRTTQSTAHNIRRKPGALEAGRNALDEHLARVGTQGRVTIDWETHAYRVRREVSPNELVFFVDDDLVPLTENWRSVLAEYFSDKGIGAVGGRILSRENLIEHAGYILGGDGVARPSFAGWKRDDGNANRQLQMPRNYSAIGNSCLVTRPELLERLGVREISSPHDAIEFCLKLREIGLRVLCVPYVELRRTSGGPSGAVECPDLAKRWPEIFQRDPFYNPNLARARADFSY